MFGFRAISVNVVKWSEEPSSLLFLLSNLRSSNMFTNPNRNRVSIDFSDTISMTKQSHKSECDINNIIKQFSKTGIINHINSTQSQYLDLPDNLDYQSSLNIISQASVAFDALPAKVRDHFANDPANLLLALQDPSQRSALEEFGILKPSAPAAAPASPSPQAPAVG